MIAVGPFQLKYSINTQITYIIHPKQYQTYTSENSRFNTLQYIQMDHSENLK